MDPQRHNRSLQVDQQLPVVAQADGVGAEAAVAVQRFAGGDINAAQRLQLPLCNVRYLER